MNNLKTEFVPDYASIPGDTLLETLEEKGITQAELALRMGRPKKTINEIIKGKTAITPETALQLEMVLGIPATFWNERERHYQETIARLQQTKQLEEWIDWLDKIPYYELVKRGWIQKFNNPVEQLRTVLAFFGVVSPLQWELMWMERLSTAFRQSTAYTTDDIAITAWVRQAELSAMNIDCAPYDEEKFRRILKEIRDLTCQEPAPEIYQDKLIDLCQQVGVAVTVVPELPRCRVFGASQWLSPQRALIAINLHLKTDDQFWFTFFHEAAHILLHSKKEVFVDVDGSEHATRSIEEIEEEANQFARSLLIPLNKLEHFIQTRPLHQGNPFFDKTSICTFARQIGVAPSIIVGRLHHDRILEFKFRNELKTTLEWGDDERVSIKKMAEVC